ncbi:beta-galactosidase [Colletotrichum tofieldiae]|uniref:Beta-galactosidase (Glycosyl hydrolase family 2) n=1 Tax=Colletotrichum tofieldiae TaxID=708197 RepID=A0A161VXD9_9PEZI|nr:beta-galactosidase (glycosyl hydrolase family 2) [Colletotrichum tofieldiae]GKT57590.1 beta-galactosidase [Colletotrichum tofieldiae]GKT77156.1 beta-galactosidase [Colletotrichum tofieldiae]
MSLQWSLTTRAFGTTFLSLLLLILGPADALTLHPRQNVSSTGRERVSINKGWRFWRSEFNPDGLIYDHRPDLENLTDTYVLKPWILPSANDFINDPAQHHERPTAEPTRNVSYASTLFDDGSWETVNLPHDWAIAGPFYTEEDPIIGGGMGRLPVHGVGWYRRSLTVAPGDEGKSIYLDVDGAMSYAMVWLNGYLVGGWPYPYNSFRLDLTSHLKPGEDNLLAIRLDNPPDSARWYPGGGIYRNVWLTKVNPVHVGQWGTYIVSKDVSAESATLDLVVEVENKGDTDHEVGVSTDVHILDASTDKPGDKVAEFPRSDASVPAGRKEQVTGSISVTSPQLWGPPPTQKPNRYVAVTTVTVAGKAVDTYETRFGIRSITYDPNQGVLVNGEHVRLQGVNQHHDLGAIGAAFNTRAAERQLDILGELGCNAIRMAHNPPASELLELTDSKGFLVMDEIFDSWERNKTANDFHLVFPDWHEPDLRSFMRRDRNHPSIIMWSFGNEVSEQQIGDPGTVVALELHRMVGEEDPTRPSTASMNFAKPNMSFPTAMDVISLNYQGEGIRDTPNYSFLPGVRTHPLYADYHDAFPEKLILGSETASALSTRGTYIFPVADDIGAPVNDTSGGNSTSKQVSAYEVYSANFGSSPDKVFSAQDKHPFVAGEFVWTGWDYVGEPTPYYAARSSYSGIIDLAGFKKDRFFLYEARWRPDLKFAHILPHWNWPDRVGETTPVHVFTSADEAELFLNGESLGRQTRAEYEYRFRWDDVKYAPGELKVVAYKDGAEWVEETVRTVGEAAKLTASADRTTIKADGKDLSFVTVEVRDANGDLVRFADNAITFSLSGPGEIIATDNGDPADLVAFPSLERKAFSGLALAIVRSEEGAAGEITITASGEGIESAEVVVTTHLSC